MAIGPLAFGGKAARLAALELVRKSVMLADNKLTITYINRQLVAFLQEAEPALRKEMPQFSVAKLIGSNIDIFHKNPHYQRGILAKLDKPHNATIVIGMRTFDLLVIPLIVRGRRSGFVVEWTDAAVRLANLDFTSQMDAISRTQAVVEFSIDGIIQNANDNFLNAMGYNLPEIIGKHHRIFVDPAEAASPEYARFWTDLAKGEHKAGEFKRNGKNGKLVWIQGAYNPISDASGKISKVIKFATNVTARNESIHIIGSALTALAEGDLTHYLDKPLTPELEPLRLDFDRATGSLKATIVSVSETAGSVQNAASEIQRSSEDLSRRTEQQAASLEETAAALDEITATVKKTAEGARHARQVVNGTKVEAEKSGSIVRDAVKSMDGIEESSNKISQIIGVIDEIAFQTNLLALNAGVEAARAGDAGRGFAVVAQEVRALAQRSAEAAKEIKTLISASTQQVEAGVNLVGETGRALERIITHVREIDTVVSDISASTQEQSTALGEINTAVNQMDRATQQNAAMVEETTAACHKLAEEAVELSELISGFEVGGSSPPAPTPGRRALQLVEA